MKYLNLTITFSYLGTKDEEARIQVLMKYFGRLNMTLMAMEGGKVMMLAVLRCYKECANGVKTIKDILAAPKDRDTIIQESRMIYS